MTEYKDVIKVLEEDIKSLEKKEDLVLYPKRYLEVFKKLITLAKTFDSVDMPAIPYNRLKEIVCYHKENDNLKNSEGIYFDFQNLLEDTINLYKPLIVKRDMRIAEQDKKIKILEKKLEMSKSNEAVLCGDCSGKGYVTKDTCILCEHERRIRKRWHEENSKLKEEIAKLKGKLQTEKRDWELTNELLKDRIDELGEAIESVTDCLESKHEENSKLKEEIEALKLSKNFMGDSATAHNEIIELQQQLQTLRNYCTLTFGESHPEIKKCSHEVELQAMKDKMSEDKIMNIIDLDYEEGNFILPYSVRRTLAKAIRQEVIGGS